MVGSARCADRGHRSAMSLPQIPARVRALSGPKSIRGASMNTLSISRRKFAHLLGVGAAAAIVRPRFTIAAEQPPKTSLSTGIVRLSANENPYGPSAKAHEAMKNAHPASNRYPEEAKDLC